MNCCLPSFCRVVFFIWLAVPAVVWRARADEPFDYFANNWNVVGLKDYEFGSRITPDNELVLSGKTPVEVRLGADRVPLSRRNPTLASTG